MKELQWDKILSTSIAASGVCINYLFGGWDMAFQTLLLLMFLDYITGLICAGKDKTLSSATGFKGLGKKMVTLIIVALGVAIDNMTGTNGVVRSLLIFFYASMEGISILENAARAGVQFPPQLKDMLIQLKEGNKKEIK
ncbi:MAG: phage holin family protein [Clostridium lundense]|nr:phage holin family protein [Clostridium lundense]